MNADFIVDERSNGVPADENTTVTFDLTNLHAWQSTDFFEMVCTNTGAINVFPGTVGETSFTDLTAQALAANPNAVLIDTINGNSFFVDQTGVGLTPKLQWSPPRVGTATFYEIHILELSNKNGNSVATRIARFLTPATSLIVPQGLLKSGLGYVFRIRPWYLPGMNFAKTPFLSGPVLGIADTISAMMQP